MHISLEAPLCCEVGDEVVEITFHEGIMTDWGAKYIVCRKGEHRLGNHQDGIETFLAGADRDLQDS